MRPKNGSVTTRRLTRPKTPSLFVMGFGTLLVAFGVAYQAATGSAGRAPSLDDSIVGGLALAVGGGAIGAAIQAVTENISGVETVGRIETIIRESLGARFTSEDSELEMFKRDWHHYYVTHVDGRHAWWHQTYPFGSNIARGSITHRTTVLDKNGRPHSYLTELGVRGERLILLETRAGGGEPAVVEIYPLPRGFATIHVAVAFLQGWDSAHLVTKAILSEELLTAAEADGPVDPAHWPALDAIWKSHFYSQNIVTLDELPLDEASRQE